MFDKKTHHVLVYLQTQCQGGLYKVFDKQDIIDAMPKRYGMTMQDVCDVVDFLQRNDYVVLKYQDDEQICVALTPRAYGVLLKDSSHTEKPKFDKKIYWIVAFVAFTASFLGVVAAKFLGF